MRRHLRTLVLIAIAGSLSACAPTQIKPEDCPAGTQKLENCPPLGAVFDEEIAALYEARRLRPAAELEEDPVEFGRSAEIPINHTRVKFLGSDNDGGLRSLALKLDLIHNAQHTVDMVYYIFRDDIVGLAVLGALCEAVQRGVDVRILIDSVGSISLNKHYLRALESCAIDAGFMRNADGQVTIFKARVQPVIFNAVSNVFVKHNRRSHDKLLVTDGHFPEKSAVITGGRNMSQDYYGILPDGSDNPDTYRDAELFLRGGDAEGESDIGVGVVSEIYFTLLFQFQNNARVNMTRMGNPQSAYRNYRQQLLDNHAKLIALPRLRAMLAEMVQYTSEGFHDAEVQLAHELANLTDTNVVRDAMENSQLNPNSIMAMIEAVPDDYFTNMQIVSPYIFAALYTDKDGNVLLDEAKRINQWLDDHPDRTIEVVTNSVLSSDNIFTQSIIDMDFGPRLLLSEELRAAWLDNKEGTEANQALVESSEWLEAISHPRLKIWATGTLDDYRFGGDVHLGKPHGKYIVADDEGFVGTTNFDYRSRLYNNEMGFFFVSKPLADEIRENTEYLKKYSYPWGSAEWLEMRARVGELKGLKASSTRGQRGIYKTIKGAGLEWMF